MPITISSLTVSPSSVIGGNQQPVLTVTLSAPAPVGGIEVPLSYSTTTGNASNNLSLLNLPDSIPVAAGQTSGSVQFTTNPVSFQWIGTPIATIIATYFDPTAGTGSQATCILSVSSYGVTGPGFPTPPSFTPANTGGYPVVASNQVWNMQNPVVNSGPNNASGEGGSQPDSNELLGQSGTRQAMSKLNVLNIGTNPPPKDGR